MQRKKSRAGTPYISAEGKRDEEEERKLYHLNYTGMHRGQLHGRQVICEWITGVRFSLRVGKNIT